MRSSRNLLALCARLHITPTEHGFVSCLDAQMDAFSSGGPEAPASQLRDTLAARRGRGLHSIHNVIADTDLHVSAVMIARVRRWCARLRPDLQLGRLENGGKKVCVCLCLCACVRVCVCVCLVCVCVCVCVCV